MTDEKKIKKCCGEEPVIEFNIDTASPPSYGHIKNATGVITCRRIGRNDVNNRCYRSVKYSKPFSVNGLDNMISLWHKTFKPCAEHNIENDRVLDTCTPLDIAEDGITYHCKHCYYRIKVFFACNNIGIVSEAMACKVKLYKEDKK